MFQTPAAYAIVLNACTFSSNCHLAPHVPAHHSSQGQFHRSLVIIVLGCPKHLTHSLTFLLSHDSSRTSSTQVISTARTCSCYDYLKPFTHIDLPP